MPGTSDFLPVPIGDHDRVRYIISTGEVYWRDDDDRVWVYLGDQESQCDRDLIYHLGPARLHKRGSKVECLSTDLDKKALKYLNKRLLLWKALTDFFENEVRSRGDQCQTPVEDHILPIRPKLCGGSLYGSPSESPSAEKSSEDQAEEAEGGPSSVTSRETVEVAAEDAIEEAVEDTVENKVEERVVPPRDD
jgi:hypothetical protein